jgi:hypothetical protein
VWTSQGRTSKIFSWRKIGYGQRCATKANWWYELKLEMVFTMQAIGHAGRAVGTIMSFWTYLALNHLPANHHYTYQMEGGKGGMLC